MPNNNSTSTNDDDSQQCGGYYDLGGPAGPAMLTITDNTEGTPTIRPPSTTLSLPMTQRPANPVDSVRDMVDGLEQIRISIPPLATKSQTSDNGLPPQAQATQALPWSDDVLEELAHLGEGAGGAVHKVKDKRTGKIMARKTITTREAPMKQLMREISIISSTEHVNIILFYGAYMSPSSSEVKILMEMGEGGSLEGVGKRIKERGALVGEKIAGRLAEGVRVYLLYLEIDQVTN